MFSEYSFPPGFNIRQNFNHNESLISLMICDNLYPPSECKTHITGKVTIDEWF